MNPAKIQGMMKKMGISQVPLNVNRVIFEMEDGDMIIDEPSVIQITMQGQKNYQVSGEARKEDKETFSEEDVSLVVKKTGKSEDEVRKFLDKNNGDIALAIVELRESDNNS